MSNYQEQGSEFAPGRTGMAAQTVPIESISIGSDQHRKQVVVPSKKPSKPDFRKLQEQKSRLVKHGVVDTTQDSRTASPFQEFSAKRQIEIQVESPIGKKGQQYFAAMNKRLSQTKVNSPEKSPKHSEERNRTIKFNDGGSVGKSGTQSKYHRALSGDNSESNYQNINFNFGNAKAVTVKIKPVKNFKAIPLSQLPPQGEGLKTGHIQINTAMKGYLGQKNKKHKASAESLINSQTSEVKMVKQESGPLEKKPSVSVLNNFEFNLPSPKNTQRSIGALNSQNSGLDRQSQLNNIFNPGKIKKTAHKQENQTIKYSQTFKFMRHSNLVIKNNEVAQTDSDESVDGVNVAQKVIITNPSGWQTLHSPSHQHSYGQGFPMMNKKEQSSLEILPSPQTIELAVNDQDKAQQISPPIDKLKVTQVIQAQTTPGLDLRDVHPPELYEAKIPNNNELKMQVIEPMLETSNYKLQKAKIIPSLKTLVAKPEKLKGSRKKNKSVVQGMKKQILERQRNEGTLDATLTYDNANTVTKDQTRLNESQSREQIYTSETRQTRKLSVVHAHSPVTSKNIDFNRLQTMISDVSIELHPIEIQQQQQHPPGDYSGGKHSPVTIYLDQNQQAILNHQFAQHQLVDASQYSNNYGPEMQFPVISNFPRQLELSQHMSRQGLGSHRDPQFRTKQALKKPGSNLQFENLLRHFSPQVPSAKLSKNISKAMLRNEKSEESRTSSIEQQQRVFSMTPMKNKFEVFRENRRKSRFSNHLLCPQLITLDGAKKQATVSATKASEQAATEEEEEELFGGLNKIKELLKRDDPKNVKPVVVHQIFDDDPHLKVQAAEFIQKVKSFNQTRKQVFGHGLKKTSQLDALRLRNLTGRAVGAKRGSVPVLDFKASHSILSDRQSHREQVQEKLVRQDCLPSIDERGGLEGEAGRGRNSAYQPVDEYTCAVTKLVQAANLQYLDEQSDKLLYSRTGQVVGIDRTLSKEEQLMDELAKKEVQRAIRLEKKKRLHAEGKLPPYVEIDSEVDGLSSVGSIHEEYGIRNFDPIAEDIKFQELEHFHLWQKNVFLQSLKVPKHAQKHKTQLFIKHFQEQKDGELNQLKEINYEQETSQILSSFRQFQTGRSNEVSQADARIRIHKKNYPQFSPTALDAYAEQLNPGAYKPDELHAKKKMYLKALKANEDFEAVLKGEQGPAQEIHNRLLANMHDRKRRTLPARRFLDRAKVYRMIKTAFDARIEALLQNDPNFHFFNTSVKHGELPKSFMDYIQNKTICIKNQSLSTGGLAALRQAFGFFKEGVHNLFLVQNGMSDQDFSQVLQEAEKMNDLKAVVYRSNQFGEWSLASLAELLAKRRPHHLEFLGLFDCQISQPVADDLVYYLTQRTNRHHLVKLSLTNLPLSAESFDVLCHYIKRKAKTITHLDISNMKVGHSLFQVMLAALPRNKRLKSINLSGNLILNPAYTRPSGHQKLTSDEIVSLKYLHLLINHSLTLVHLDLTNTNLNEIVVKRLLPVIKSQNTLQSIHLSGNPGVTPAAKKQACEVLQTDDTPLTRPDLQIATAQPTSDPGYQERLVNDALLIKAIKEKQELKVARKYEDVEFAEERTLIIQRNLGCNEVCSKVYHGPSRLASVDQWRVCTQRNAECWICTKKQLVIFLWSPSVHKRGQAEMKYLHKPLVLSQFADPEGAQQVPYVYCEGTNWQPAAMSSMRSLCKDLDKERPNFLDALKKKKAVRPVVTSLSELTPGEQASYNAAVADYEKVYDYIYLDFLEQQLTYKDPYLANLDCIIQKPAGSEQIHYYAQFLSAGKHQIVVRSPDGSKVQFQILNDLREEPLPPAWFDKALIGKPKLKPFNKANSVFAEYKEDDPQLLLACLKHDQKHWKVPRLTKSEADLEETYKLLLQNMQWLKDWFLTLAINSKYPFVGGPDYFVKGVQQTGIIDANLNVGALDRIFRAANITSEAWVDLLGKKVKHTYLLSRNQFIEAIVRCAQTKYLLPAGIPASEKKLHIATQKILEEIRPNAVIYNHHQFRKLMWDTKISNLFKKNEENLRSIMTRYIKGNSMMYQFMTLENVMAMFQTINLTQSEVLQMYALSKSTNVEEYNDQSLSKYNRIRFVELIELIGRVAEQQLSSENADPAELKKLIEEVLEDVYKAHDIVYEDEEEDVSDESSGISDGFEY